MREPLATENSRCCSLPIRWTKLLCASAPDSKNIISFRIRIGKDKRATKKAGPQTRPAASRNLVCRDLVCRAYQFRGEKGLETPLFALVVHHHHRNDAQNFLAAPARGHFAVQVLHKAVAEVIFAMWTPRRLAADCPAVRAHKFEAIVLRIAIQRRAPGATDSHCLRT